MRFGLRVRAALASAFLAGCALIAGLDDGSGRGAAPSDAGADRAVLDGGGIDAAGCAPEELPDTMLPVVKRLDAARPVTVDGDGAEWDCVDRWVFRDGDRRVDLVRASARIAMQYDENALYLFATLTTATPSGTAPARSSFQNDSFHWFVTGPAPGTAYTNHDHHIVVDALDQASDFFDVAGVRPTLDGIAAKASPVRLASAADTQIFDVEIRVTPNALGRTTFRAGEKIRMNFQINDGPPAGGKVGPPYRIWFVNAAACPPRSPDCAINGASEPYCNPLCTQGITLE